MRITVPTICLVLLGCLSAGSAAGQEVIVLAGNEQVVAWLKSENWWGESKRGEQLQVPHVMITGISKDWQQESQKITVAEKKEIFYRFILPLIMRANEVVLDRRERLTRFAAELSEGSTLPPPDLVWLRKAAVLLRITDEEAAAQLVANDELLEVIEEALYKLDVVPPGLALGQAAYESGYGTSRFAVSANALFGQWTFGGKGLVPEQQRKNLGDHRIAAFDWPFDSVRSYFINLSSHPAYEDFRRLRAELKSAGKPVTSLALADGLIRYSERGQAYVDTLKGIIRVNGLDVADNAVFRDEPIRFVVGAADDADATRIQADVEQMRDTGELANLILRMRLE